MSTAYCNASHQDSYLQANCFHAVCGSSVGGACQPPPPHTPQTQTLPHTLSQEATNGGQRTRTSVWIRDSLQQHSQATLSLRECLSLSRHHLIYTSTLTHTHTHRTLLQSIFPYLSLFSCHETVSLRARNAVRSTVSQTPQHVSYHPLFLLRAGIKIFHQYCNLQREGEHGEFSFCLCLWRFFPYFACI